MDMSSTQRTDQSHGLLYFPDIEPGMVLTLSFRILFHSDGASRYVQSHQSFERSLCGPRVLITGAARGLGREIAVSFARAGVSGIAVLDILCLDTIVRDLPEAAEKAGRSKPDILPIVCDITKIEAVERAAQLVQERWQVVDILINNAGYLAPYSPLGESDPEKWWRNWEVNVKGVYLMIRAFLPLLLNSEEKTAVVLSSVGAHHTLPGGSGYETTKLAVLKINNYLMAEYGSEGLLVYAVAPGGVKTDMAPGFPEKYHHLLTDTPQMVADTITFLTKERREWLAARYVDSRWDIPELLEKKDHIVKNDLLKVKLCVQ